MEESEEHGWWRIRRAWLVKNQKCGWWRIRSVAGEESEERGWWRIRRAWLVKNQKSVAGEEPEERGWWRIRRVYLVKNQKSVAGEESEECGWWRIRRAWLVKNQKSVASEESEECSWWVGLQRQKLRSSLLRTQSYQRFHIFQPEVNLPIYNMYSFTCFALCHEFYLPVTTTPLPPSYRDTEWHMSCHEE